MTINRFFLAAIAGFALVFIPSQAEAQTPVAVLPAVEIAKIKAQEFSRSLAQLKIQEVTLERATPVDQKAVSLNRAQQNALEQELVNLAVAPLVAERDRWAQDLRPAHPKMVALDAEIENARASITGSH